MPAKTSWWYCGSCGFDNHPRLKADNAKCEQCGASNSEGTDHPAGNGK